jgi:hypothetical protein
MKWQGCWTLSPIIRSTHCVVICPILCPETPDLMCRTNVYPAPLKVELLTGRYWTVEYSRYADHRNRI